MINPEKYVGMTKGDAASRLKMLAGSGEAIKNTDDGRSYTFHAAISPEAQGYLGVLGEEIETTVNRGEEFDTFKKLIDIANKYIEE